MYLWSCLEDKEPVFNPVCLVVVYLLGFRDILVTNIFNEIWRLSHEQGIQHTHLLSLSFILVGLCFL